MTGVWMWSLPVGGGVALAYAFWQASWLRRQNDGDETLQHVGGLVRGAALALLRHHVRSLAIVVVLAAGILAFVYRSGPATELVRHPLIAAAYLAGALAAALAGVFAVRNAARAQVRAAAAARVGLAAAFHVVCSSGAAVGLGAMGAIVSGLGLLTIALAHGFPGAEGQSQALAIVPGFALGACTVTLLVRVGGSLYAAAAGLDRDLERPGDDPVPSDDPHHPAAITTVAGTTTGGAGGVTVDFCDSSVGAIVAAMVLGLGFEVVGGSAAAPVLLPLLLAVTGIVSALATTLFLAVRAGGAPRSALAAGSLGGYAVALALAYAVIRLLWPESAVIVADGSAVTAHAVWVAVAIGTAAGVATRAVATYFGGLHGRSVVHVVVQSRNGRAANIIAGMTVGMRAAGPALLVLAAAVVGAHTVAGGYGVAMAALGMLSTVGTHVALAAFAPLTANGAAVAAMSHQPADVRDHLRVLATAGAHGAPASAGLATAAAATTALALLAAYVQQARVQALDLSDAWTLGALLVGATLPFLVGAAVLKSVARSAAVQGNEVRRQFAAISGLRDGRADPDAAVCVDVTATAVLRALAAPGALALLVPVAVGLARGRAAVGSLLLGTIVTGVLLATFMNAAGSAWGNAERTCEPEEDTMSERRQLPRGADFQRVLHGGAMLGTLLKDAAGPSVSAFVKLMAVVALVLAPLLV